MAALSSSLSSTLAAAVLLVLLGAVLRYADATVLRGKHGKPQQPYKQPYQKMPYGYQKEFPDYPLTSPDNCTAIPVENVKVGGAVVLSPQRTALGLSYPEWHTAWWRAMYRQDAINHPLDPEADPLNSGCVAAIRSDFEGTFYYDLFGKDLGGTYKKDDYYRDKKDDDYRDYKKSPPPAYFISGVLGSPVTPSVINRRCTNIIAETPIIFPMLNQGYFFAPGVDEQFFPRGRPSSESAASQVAGAVSECADDVFALINGERVPLTSEFGSVSTFVRDMDISGGTFEVVDRLFNVSLYSAAFPKGIKDIDAMDAGYYIILPKGLPYKGKTFKHTLEFGLARNCTTTFEFFDRAVNEPPSAGNCTTTTFAYTATTYRYSITVQKPY